MNKPKRKWLEEQNKKLELMQQALSKINPEEKVKIHFPKGTPNTKRKATQWR